MRKLVIIFLVMTSVLAYCQTYTGVSKKTTLQKVSLITSGQYYSPQAYIECLIKGNKEDLSFYFILPRLDKHWDISKGAKVAFEYYNGDKNVYELDSVKQELYVYSNFVNSKYSMTYARCRVDFEKITTTPIKQIIIQRDCGDIYDIYFKVKKAGKLCKQFEEMIQESRMKAYADKVKKEKIKEYFGDKLEAPAHVKEYLTGQDYKVLKVDTVEMPVRLLLGVQFTIAVDHSRAVDACTAASAQGREAIYKVYNEQIAIGDSLFNEYNILLQMADSVCKAECPSADGYQNYQRVAIEIGGITKYIYSDSGKISETAMSIDKEFSKCRELIEQYKAYLERRKQALKNMGY